MSEVALADEVTVKVHEAKDAKPKRPPVYNLIVFDHDKISFEFVIAVFMQVIPCTAERGLQLANVIHTSGKAIVWTGYKEVAELKLEQIRTFVFAHPTLTGGAHLKLECSIEPAA